MYIYIYQGYMLKRGKAMKPAMCHNYDPFIIVYNDI